MMRLLLTNKSYFPKKGIKNDLEIRISSFMKSEVYKELILKEKLFLKNDNDKSNIL